MTSKSFFKTANILHRAFLGGSILTVVVAIYVNATDKLILGPEVQLTNILMIITLIMGLWGIIGSLFISNMLMKKAATEESLGKKMARYRAVLVVRSAITEGAVLLGGVAFMITGSMICLAVAVICTVFLAFMRPDKEEAKRSLQLSSSDAMKLDREEAEF